MFCTFLIKRVRRKKIQVEMPKPWSRVEKYKKVKKDYYF